jgi:uncharacterized membrane protein
MGSRVWPLIAFFATIVWLIGETALALPHLRERIAVHFDAGGQPNGWATPIGLLSDVMLISAIAGLIFAGAGLLEAIPTKWLNVPNRRHWLAPERAAESVAFIRDWTRWFLVVTMAFLAIVFGLLLSANLQIPPKMSGAVFGAVFIYLGATIAMLAALIWRFRRSN